MWEWVTSPSTWVWFTEPFRGQNWWQILNAGFVGTFISSLVGIYVARNVGQVARETETATAVADAKRAVDDAKVALNEAGVDTREEVDATEPAAAAPQLDEASRRAFTTAGMSIRRLKDFVEAVADRCRDGRTRRKYGNVSRRDYRIIIAALSEDGGLKPADSKRLLDAFEEWRTYRNGRVAVPSDIANRLQDLANRYRVTSQSPVRWTPRRPDAVSAEVQGGAQ